MLASALLLLTAAVFGAISTLVLGVVLGLVLLLPALVFHSLARSSAFFMESASASVSCLLNTMATFAVRPGVTGLRRVCG